MPDILRRLLATCLPTSTALGARDRAMLLLGFGAALRLRIRRSRIDQHGAGEVVAV